MKKKKTTKKKLPKNCHRLKQFKELITFLFGMILTTTTIIKNILDMFK